MTEAHTETDTSGHTANAVSFMARRSAAGVKGMSRHRLRRRPPT
jgi:hypothetical protein